MVEHSESGEEGRTIGEEEPLVTEPVVTEIEEELQPEIDEAEVNRKEAEEFKQKYYLLLAEMENARKRMQKEKDGVVQYAVESALLEFLGPLDHFETALGFAEGMSSEVKNWAKGFEMILLQLKEVLASNGFVAFDVENGKFNPHEHEVVEIVETVEEEDGTVLKQFAKGYRVGKRVLRPAKIKIARRPTTEGEEAVEEESFQEKSKNQEEDKEN
ncbi:nucleotide exchange factor GrpE [Simkania negevensis]|uniref:Protein GrpE n=1 Tax=Simkania negevensis TaxID=83561 RepID=A0ABS3ART8_9BACT|nr:nucleotide exchange factor GrpE [Simkania negevensis]